MDAVNKLLYAVGSRARKHLHLISESGRSLGCYGHYVATEALLALSNAAANAASAQLNLGVSGDRDDINCILHCKGLLF